MLTRMEKARRIHHLMTIAPEVVAYGAAIAVIVTFEGWVLCYPEVVAVVVFLAVHKINRKAERALLKRFH